MISEEHQKLVNALAKAWESKENIKVTAIDIRGTPELFEPKYRDLPQPTARNGLIPDLGGMDANGTNHIGEAETDMDTENLNDQLKVFSNRSMTDTKAHVPLHVIVPKRIKSQMDDRIAYLRQTGQLDDGEIHVWS